MTADLDDRLARARAAAAAAGLDALLITPGAGLRYLTGYEALPLERLTCLVLPVDGTASLVVPGLEEPASVASGAGKLALDIRTWQETDDAVALAAGLLPGVRRVGLDDQMWAEKALRFRAAMPDAEQVAAGAVLSELRIRKSEAEVEALREAAAAIDRVHARMAEWLRPGRTEAEVGRDIAAAMVAEGHVRADFVLVASGPNTASPHHESSGRVIQAGDPVFVDIGGTTEAGYCSDSTRTYAAGDPGAEYRAAYDALQAAQAAAVAHVRPGVTAESVDAAARSVLTQAGLGEAFVHRTGHGIGLETHEEPYIVAGNTLPLEPGMAFSVEPGFYLAGRHGARIEDIVVVTADGVEALNRRPRDLVILDT
ncbi:aminopeptidase P family protein [Jiangella ureilytica]|uniref:Aminopeptidase P family protein n=1 Tax=Jiangella ureilytica TaxID=2530374 RepID=A0A4R4RRT2_9ACTN|nr:Xaa-Pro peptidase family protein [Jiangella ureilytica]TDC52284.1 aminopeptidase P family protein [Jiangella ureilytica]